MSQNSQVEFPSKNIFLYVHSNLFFSFFLIYSFQCIVSLIKTKKKHELASVQACFDLIQFLLSI